MTRPKMLTVPKLPVIPKATVSDDWHTCNHNNTCSGSRVYRHAASGMACVDRTKNTGRNRDRNPKTVDVTPQSRFRGSSGTLRRTIAGPNAREVDSTRGTPVRGSPRLCRNIRFLGVLQTLAPIGLNVISCAAACPDSSIHLAQLSHPVTRKSDTSRCSERARRFDWRESAFGTERA